jgi:hypothetical protein
MRENASTRSSTDEASSTSLGGKETHSPSRASLAVVWLRIVTAIIEGAAPAKLTVNGTGTGLPYSWAE